MRIPRKVQSFEKVRSAPPVPLFTELLVELFIFYRPGVSKKPLRVGPTCTWLRRGSQAGITPPTARKRPKRRSSHLSSRCPGTLCTRIARRTAREGYRCQGARGFSGSTVRRFTSSPRPFVLTRDSTWYSASPGVSQYRMVDRHNGFLVSLNLLRGISQLKFYRHTAHRHLHPALSPKPPHQRSPCPSFGGRRSHVKLTSLLRHLRPRCPRVG